MGGRPSVPAVLGGGGGLTSSARSPRRVAQYTLRGSWSNRTGAAACQPLRIKSEDITRYATSRVSLYAQGCLPLRFGPARCEQLSPGDGFGLSVTTAQMADRLVGRWPALMRRTAHRWRPGSECAACRRSARPG